MLAGKVWRMDPAAGFLTSNLDIEYFWLSRNRRAMSLTTIPKDIQFILILMCSAGSGWP
jgi:hypothetical protein